MKFKIGQEVHWISESMGAWSRYSPTSGRVISFDEKTVVVFGLPPQHNSWYNHEETMSFLDIEKTKFYQTDQDMMKAARKLAKNG